MRDAVREALQAAEQRDAEDLQRDSIRAFGIIQLIEIFGEAPRHVFEPARGDIRDLDGPAIVAMRNNLVHGSFHIDFHLVMRTRRRDPPPLLDAVERYGDAYNG